MNIVAVDIFLLEVPLGGQIFNPRLVWHRKQSVLLRITNEEGREGWGECWCFDSSADVLIRFLQTEIIPGIRGRRVENIDAFCMKLWALISLTGRHGMTAAAISAIDVALHDLQAQAAGVPLGLLPGTEARPTVPVYASAGLYRVKDSLARLREEMAGHIADGHNRVKMKFGALSFDEDVARMRAAREAIGLHASLLVDAVYSLDQAQAKAWLPVWRELGVEAVQAPFPAQDRDSMRWLNRDCGMPVMVFEAESRFDIFRAMLEYGAIGMLQFSPIAVGGITAARHLIALAEEHAVPVSLQCSSTWLAQAIALELARGHSQIVHVELHCLHRGLFETAPAAEIAPRDGHLYLHNRPGLGMSPPPDKLALMTSDLPDFQRDYVVANRQIHVGSSA